MKSKPWILTQKRFIAFFDILGFKDLVESNSHLAVLEKLDSLKQTISRLEASSNHPDFKERDMDDDQTRVVTFSDSFIFFSKSDQYHDALKILYDANAIITRSAKEGIPIKGAIAYGEITVDFPKSLFFGKPIIDAYLLHEELQMITTIFHHTFEAKLRDFSTELLEAVYTDFRSNLKSGKITHKIMKPFDLESVQKQMGFLQKMLYTASGRHRIYVDNTLNFLETLIKKKSLK